MKNIISKLDFTEIFDHYNVRIDVHRKINDDLQELIDIENGEKTRFEFKRKQFVNYILGLVDIDAGYTANSVKRLGCGGPAILSENPQAYKQVYELEKYLKTTSPLDIPNKIKGIRISYLGLGIGSEMACLLRPNICWVTNRRTYWIKLLFDRENISYANEMTKSQSEIALKVWHIDHPIVGAKLKDLVGEVDPALLPSNLDQYFYLFADCIATSLYDYFYE